MSVKQVNPEELQELLDGGYRIMEIKRKLQLPHHMYVRRAINYYKLEYYVAFDEYEYKYDPSSAMNFEWTWEEDRLDEILRRLYEDGVFNLSSSDLDMEGLSKYTNETYGGIMKYLTTKNAWFLAEGLMMKCRSCKNDKYISDFYIRRKNTMFTYFGISYECIKCSTIRGARWNRDNPEVIRKLAKIYRDRNPRLIKRISTESQAKRRALDLHLGYDFSVKENERIFGTTCVLTGDTDIAYDHFVPLNWGHVGSYNRNMYPLNQRLNSSKWAHNPFDWFEDNHERFGLDRRKFDDLVATLAELSGLSPDEYKDFVYWCEANKREPEDIAIDPRPSLEIWRDSMKVGDVT